MRNSTQSTLSSPDFTSSHGVATAPQPTAGGSPVRGAVVSLAACAALAILPGCADEAAAQDTSATDEATVRAFYSDILSTPADRTEERFYEIFSPDVVSTPTPPAGPGAQGMLDTTAFLGQVVPDLSWVPDDVINVGDGRFVVRSTATGTPVGPFFGVDPPTGRSFTIMAIDILTVADGRIVNVYHVEDWFGAVAQLTAAE